MKKNLKLIKLKPGWFDGDLRKYPKFKSGFTKNIQTSYKTKKVVFYLSEKVQEGVDRLTKCSDNGKHIGAIMTAARNIPKYSECHVTEIINMIKTNEKVHQDSIRLEENRSITQQ